MVAASHLPSIPPLDELLESARVVSLPLTTRFRGIEHREAMLLRDFAYDIGTTQIRVGST